MATDPILPDKKEEAWLDNPFHLKGQFKGVTDKIVESTVKATNWDKSTVRDAVPFVAAGTVGIVGALLGEQLSDLGKIIMKPVRWVAGKLHMEGVIDSIGDASGYVMSAIGAFLTFKMFQSDSRDKTDP